MQKLRQKLIVLLMLPLLSGCATSAATSAWVKPICVSKADVLTDGTMQQIVTHDETLGKSCK